MSRKAPASRQGGSNAPIIGGTFLRAGDIAAHLKNSDHLFIEVEERYVTRQAQADAIAGPMEGRYGVDVPTTIGVAPYVVTLPTFTEDYTHLLGAWGDDLDGWIGKSLAIWPQPVTERGPSGDVTKTYLRFRPAEEVLTAGPAQQPLPGAPPSTFKAVKPKAITTPQE